MKNLRIKAILTVVCLSHLPLKAKEIHKERSIYRNIVITEEANNRCMRFENRSKRITNQACIDLINPKKIVFEYVKNILTGYAINPDPKRILIIGLGGGTLSNVMHELTPKAEIINVDIDPVVVKLAKKYFDYQQTSQIKTEIKDGRVFVKRALLDNQKFDWIVLDAFNGDYIPEHLMTREFLAEVKGLLSENGFVTANTFSSSVLYDYESATYFSVFGQLQTLKSPNKGNRVIFACNCNSFEHFPEMPDALHQSLLNFGVDSKELIKKIDSDIDWDNTSQLLTDQYSPANLLKKHD